MDPKEYPDPEVFRPERFLSAPGNRLQRDPSKVTFGFGRRACPGEQLAENTIFIMATHILAVFDIAKAVRDDGTEVEPAVKYTIDGVVRNVDRFECSIKPRSKEAAGIIALE